MILVLKSSVNEGREAGRDEQKDWQGTHMSAGLRRQVEQRSGNSNKKESWSPTGWGG